jgi:hypothetical protein
MNTHEEADLWHALYCLEARYWHEVDSNGGRTAHEFYVPDGLLVVGHNRFRGQDKIREFYVWREHHCTTMGSSLKTMRHLISNLFIGSRMDRAPRSWASSAFMEPRLGRRPSPSRPSLNRC